jgi:DNA modification methylase
LNTTWRVLVGDVRDKLAELPAGSVQCCVTSPPYFGLRDYGVAGQIGLERTPAEFVAEMVNLFRLVREAMREDGTLWLNLGDSYAGYWGDKKARDEGRASSADTNGWTNGFNMNARPQFDHLRGAGLKPKDLIGIPWRVALALQADGWYLRSDIIWHKPNPMPESVTDRPTKSHEYVFLLTKAERYYYDAEAIAEPCAEVSLERVKSSWKCDRVNISPAGNGSIDVPVMGSRWAPEEGRNCRSVWSIATQSYPEAHFATFPEALPERCIKAGSKEGDTVLDPFCGSGTTGAVSMRLGRHFVGIELNPAYAELSRKRIGSALPMFSQEVPA